MISLMQGLRRLRTLLWTVFSILVISAAILVGLGKLLMPYSDRYQPQLEDWLSGEFGYPVSVESFSGQWRAFGPRLTLKGLRIKPESVESSADELLIAEAALDLKPWSLLLPDQSLYRFLVIGADLQLVRDVAGSLHLSGLGLNSQATGTKGTNAAGEQQEFELARLVGVGDLHLEGSRLEVVDEKSSLRLHLSEINAHLQLSDDRLAMSLEAHVFDQSNQWNYGTVEGVAVASFAADGRLQNVGWQMSIVDLLLDRLHDQLPAHPLLPNQGELVSQQRGQWSEQSGWSVLGKVEVRNARFSNESTDLAVDQFTSQFAWQGSDKEAWRLDLHEARLKQGESQWQMPGLVVARDVRQNLGLWLGADYVPLQETMRLARQFMSLSGREWPEQAPQEVSGSLSAFDLVLAADGSNRFLAGDFRNIAANNWQGRPTFSGLNGQARLQSGQGYLSLNAPILHIDWPDMFSERLQLSLPECQAELEIGSQWQIHLQSCQLFNDDLSVRGDVHVAASPGKPAADINVEVLRMDMARLSPYWPERTMPGAVIQWLRSHLHAGQISKGRLQIHGDLDNWPFRHGDGRFEARAEVDEGVLSFSPNWPELQSIKATTMLVGAGVRVEGQVGSFGGTPVQQATAEIEDFGRAILRLDFAGQNEIDEVMRLLQQTPLMTLEDFDLNRFQFGGFAETRGQLVMPLGRQPGTLQVNGSSNISRGSFLDQTSGVLVDAISGRLEFDKKQVRAENLAARYKGNPAELDLQVGGDPQWSLVAGLHGEFDVADVLPEFLLQNPAFTRRMSGSTGWLAQVRVPAKTATRSQSAFLQVDSTLQGVELDLPEPLTKAGPEVWPFSLRYPLSGESRLLELELNDQLHMAAEIHSNSSSDNTPAVVKRAVIALGPATPYLVAEALPSTEGLSLTGKVASLDLDGWLDLVVGTVRSGGGLGGLELDTCTVFAEKMIFLDRWFEQTGLEVKVTGSEIRADFDASDINGHLTFTIGLNAQNSLNAEFDRLALGVPISDATESDSNPANLPELHLYAQSFRYVGLEMGETRIEAYPTSEGFHFEKIEANSDSLSLRASGDWFLLEQEQRSAFDIMMTAESLGELLHSLGLSSSLQGGQTVVNFHAWWPGSPAAFALARLNGEIDFNITRGQITNASSGTGKVLGLLSLQALPRRLSLDFRDVFDSGFGFETASGTFQMQNGTATTKDVTLTSSAARINLSGSTDLVNRQYDQQMTVMPGVGNTLPVIGALAAGPGGAAAGLALQGLLHDQLGKATQVHYTIGGSWDDPVVEPAPEPMIEPVSDPASEPVPETPLNATQEPEPGLPEQNGTRDE